MPPDKVRQRELVIRLLRIGGAMLATIGLFLYFNFGKLATILNLDQDNMNEVIGPVLTLIGFLDIVVGPIILNRAWEQKDKTRL